VEPMLCLPLPSANTSRYQPCSSANTSPCRAYKGLEPSSVCDMPGAPIKTEQGTTPKQLKETQLRYSSDL
ncbi:MAG: hypothetical protein AAGA77_19790, partial [Bacteroidota bacterium]